MAYIITKTNGDALVTVPDTEKNTDYGVTLVGRNYSGYGVFLNDNFIALMEHFAGGTAPVTPLDGQLWFSTTTKHLSLWEGSAWKVLSSITSSESEPGSAGRKIGDLWFDATNYQLKLWTGITEFERNVTVSTTGNIVSITSALGLTADDRILHANISVLNDVRISQVLNATQIRMSANAVVSSGDLITFQRGASWYNIGPDYTKSQKTNGIIPTTVVDTLGIPHTLGIIYVDGSMLGSISNDSEYTPNTATAIDGFPTVKPGIQLKSGLAEQISKTVQSLSVGSSGFTLIQLVSNTDLLVGDRYISANVSLASGAQITALYANNAVVVNVSTSVFTNEQIVFQRGTEVVRLYNGTASNSQKLANKSADLFAQLDQDANFQQNLSIDGNVTIGTPISITTTTSNLTIRNSRTQGNIRFVSNVFGIGEQTTIMNLDGVSGLVTVRADPEVALGVSTKQYVDATRDLINGYIASNIADIVSSYATVAFVEAQKISPAFSGTPTAPTRIVSDNTTALATTAFVKAAISDLAPDLTVYAPVASPTFTGTPAAPTVGNALSSTTQLATTAFVQAAIVTRDIGSWLPTNKTISAFDPVGGNNGDFWFKV